MDRATLEKEIAYEQDKLAARDWGIAQYNRGRPLNEIVPVLRLKYYRAWRKFIR